MRVIRARERRDKWRSVGPWMCIGAPYRSRSFVCGHTLSLRGDSPDYTHSLWESHDLPWILRDVLTAAWWAIVLSAAPLESPLFLHFFFLSTEFEIALEPCQLLYRLFSVDFNWQLGWKKNARVYDEKYIALGSSSIILLVIHGSVLGALKEINGLCKFAFTFL